MLRGVLLDLAGVVYDGDTLIPGSAEAIGRLREAGLSVRFISNTTRSPRKALVAQLAGFGIQVADDEVLTPAGAAIAWLLENGRSPHLVVHPKLGPEFDGVKFAGPPAVVVGDAGETFDYAMLNRAFRQLMDGADFIALANNRVFKDRDGLRSMDAGAFVAALEFASGAKATVIGKPAPAFFEAGLRARLRWWATMPKAMSRGPCRLVSVQRFWCGPASIVRATNDASIRRRLP
jgi:HAD superfamily hydrolase (TIGR01458 family)